MSEVVRVAPLPEALVGVKSAKFPAAYESAKIALAECARLDECKDWADKAAALHSYAKQSDDRTLERMAARIRARAIKRTGELLREFQTGEKGGRPKENDHGSEVVSQAQAGADAGMSRRQIETASALAKIPEAEFEAAVERETPATITELRNWKRPQDIEAFKKATAGIGRIQDFAKFCKEHDFKQIAAGLSLDEAEDVGENAEDIRWWLAGLLEWLPEDPALSGHTDDAA